MACLFDGKLHVEYHSAELITLAADGLGLLPDRCFAGQVNGLCGAAVVGALMFTTGLHSGPVGFTIDVLDVAPPLDESWEEIVEVSFVTDDDTVVLNNSCNSLVRDLPLAPGTYRARYCARGFDKGKEININVSEDPVDFYSLIFWPAPVAPDVILKRTSLCAGYWHQAYQPEPGLSDSED